MSKVKNVKVKSAAVKEADLPQELTAFESVEAAYPAELARCQDAMRRGLSVIVECDKELVPYFYRIIRDRLKAENRRCIYLDGRPDPNAPPNPMQAGFIGTMISQLRDAVRGAVDDRVVVMPHLDLLTTSSGGLTNEAKEAIPLMYENPNIIWLGFKDPTFDVPKTIKNIFPHRESILGIPRDRLRFLVTQKEARKLGREFNPYALYKYVSGQNAVRIRRLLASLTGEDYPANTDSVYAQIRQATLAGELCVPDMSMDDDIGGYTKVKDRIKNEIINIMATKDLGDPTEVKRIEDLIPRGMIFWGPPGCSKTMFAKAMASALGCAVTVVSGPELKSKWYGESEENLRQIFTKARQAAPAMIIFDELDSFAGRRGMYAGSAGVDHSMVNQLLTEMDGFRKDELVFVVGTTNFVESIDPALLRPGRFEFHLNIPYPDPKDRRVIFDIYNAKFNLNLTERALEYCVKLSGGYTETGTRYSGDHIQAICRSLARNRLRTNTTGPTESEDIDRVQAEYANRPELTSEEQKAVATHESGHAICSLFCENSPPIDRITITGDLAGALGYVSYGESAHKYVTTENQLRDNICMMFGGRQAEHLFYGDVSIGSAHDLEMATATARALVEEFGMGINPEFRGFKMFCDPKKKGDDTGVSERIRDKIDTEVEAILRFESERAKKIVTENKTLLTALRDLLLEKKSLDRQSFAHLVDGKVPAKKNEKKAEDAPAVNPNAKDKE